MPDPATALQATTPSGYLLVLSLMLPVAAVLVAFVAGGRRVERLALLTMPFGLAIAVLIANELRQGSGTLVYLLGGLPPPLGVALRADGPSAVMMVIVALVVCAVGVFARTSFGTPAGVAEARAPFAFWLLLLAVWAALNTVFLSGDLFTLYVALELLTFGAVPLVCLDGRGETLQAALRYALFALIGSVFYLAGCALLYGACGTLDVALVSERIHAEPATLAAAALMTVGLLAKTALVPLHLWLPPAHAGAPPAASAVLSALVVKGSFFIVVRLWFDVMPRLPGVAAAQMLGGLGALAIVLGSVVALRQERLKLLIAYSTLAQIGYLFLMFPLALDPLTHQLEAGAALAGGILQAISHAMAKAAMFMAAGLMYATLGHDRIAELAGMARARPLTVLAFALGGVSLMGVLPSGAYAAKTLLLGAAAESDQWWWTLVLQGGGVFTASYVVLVLARVVGPAARSGGAGARVSRSAEGAALALAVGSFALGFVRFDPLLPVPPESSSSGLTLAAVWKVLWPFAGGALLAILLARAWQPQADALGAIRGAATALGVACEKADGVLRRWPVAGLSLLVLVLAFGAAMLAG